MKKSIGILLYLALMAVFLKFDLRLLFDLRQFLLVLFGTVLLLLPSLKEKEGQEGKGRMVSKMKCFLRKRGRGLGRMQFGQGFCRRLCCCF